MLKENDRVRHQNSETDALRGVMIIRTIKGDYAFCGYNDFNKVGVLLTFPLKDLKRTND